MTTKPKKQLKRKKTNRLYLTILFSLVIIIPVAVMTTLDLMWGSRNLKTTLLSDAYLIFALIVVGACRILFGSYLDKYNEKRRISVWQKRIVSGVLYSLFLIVMLFFIALISSRVSKVDNGTNRRSTPAIEGTVNAYLVAIETGRYDEAFVMQYEDANPFPRDEFIAYSTKLAPYLQGFRPTQATYVKIWSSKRGRGHSTPYCADYRGTTTYSDGTKVDVYASLAIKNQTYKLINLNIKRAGTVYKEQSCYHFF